MSIDLLDYKTNEASHIQRRVENTVSYPYCRYAHGTRHSMEFQSDVKL
jgi:hypothetical protein